MDRWLSSGDADHRKVSLARRSPGDRPADVPIAAHRSTAWSGVSVAGVARVQLKDVQTRFGRRRPAPWRPGHQQVLSPAAATLRLLPEIEFIRRAVAALGLPSPPVLRLARPVGPADTIRGSATRTPGGQVVYGGRPLGPAPDDPVAAGRAGPSRLGAILIPTRPAQRSR